MDKNILHLKKYSNRRLYDTGKSVYVTLDNVTDIIRQGRQIQVTDAKTGEDVTPAILTQIVLEEARKKKFLLPPPLLYLIIQYGENIGINEVAGNDHSAETPSRKRNKREKSL